MRADVYCDRRLSAEARSHEVLLGECLGGALAVNDFLRLAHQVSNFVSSTTVRVTQRTITDDTVVLPHAVCTASGLCRTAGASQISV
jgi:hypothetical protein